MDRELTGAGVMVAGAVLTKTSYHQAPLDRTYPHGLVAFTGLDGVREDPIFRNNLSAAATLVADNRLLAVIAEVRFRPGDQEPVARAFKAAVTETLGRVPRWLSATIAVSSRQGTPRRNHSAGLNRLYVLLATVLDGDPRRVLAYGNRRDVQSQWPVRPAGLGIVVAEYARVRPRFPNLVAWHYTNGENEVGRLPSATQPFGPCDHLVTPGLTPAQAAETLGAFLSPTTDPWEEVMAMYPSKEAFEAMLDRKLGIDPANSDRTGRTDANGLLAFWLTRTIHTLRTGSQNKAFAGPETVVDGVGLEGTLSSTIASVRPTIDREELNAAVAEAVAPVVAQVAELQRTIDDALNADYAEPDLGPIS